MTKEEDTLSNSTDCEIRLPHQSDKELTARFDGGKLSSDGGLLALELLDRRERVTEELAACVKDRRDPRYVEHDLYTLIRQRIFQIMAGYEDCNDAGSLRSDPIFKTICGRRPDSDPDLGSQPTLSRLENQVTRRDLVRIGRWLLERYVEKRKRERPSAIHLDIDTTDDPAHGQQQFAFFNAYYDTVLYRILLVFDAETGEIAGVLLLAGNVSGVRQVAPLLRRIVGRLREALPETPISIRADSGFEGPELYRFCESQGVSYTIGVRPNSAFAERSAELRAQAEQARESTGEPQIEYGEFSYRCARWWARETRRFVYKVEARSGGDTKVFTVITNRTESARELRRYYEGRGQAENYIKALKNHLKADRLSCHRFLANQFRLFLHVAAYALFGALRERLQGSCWAGLEIETVRRRALKIAAQVRETSRRIWVHFSSYYPEKETFAQLCNQLGKT